MRLFLVALAALALCAHGADKKKRPPDVQIVETKVVRVGGLITLDVRLRATGEKPIRNVVVTFDFMASGKSVLASKRAELDEDVLEPGDESSIHAESEYPAHAIQYKIRAYLPGDRELDVANPGPYPILYE